MNPLLIPLQIQIALIGVTFQAATALLQMQSPLMRLSVPGAMLPSTLRAGCGGIAASR